MVGIQDPIICKTQIVPVHNLCDSTAARHLGRLLSKVFLVNVEKQNFILVNQLSTNMYIKVLFLIMV